MQDNPDKPLSVHCPTCRKQVEWSDANPFRPFCSERCQMIDLGAWAAEEYRIPDRSPVLPDDEDEDLTLQ